MREERLEMQALKRQHQIEQLQQQVAVRDTTVAHLEGQITALQKRITYCQQKER
jgi:hypothetical protein